MMRLVQLDLATKTPRFHVPRTLARKESLDRWLGVRVLRFGVYCTFLTATVPLEFWSIVGWEWELGSGCSGFHFGFSVVLTVGREAGMVRLGLGCLAALRFSCFVQ
jgi:hypothetical protein